MNKLTERNLKRKRFWLNNSSRRWGKSNYRISWGSARLVYAGWQSVVARANA